MEKKEIKISTMGLNCPKPLIETRKALNKMRSGQTLRVEGNHGVSFKEIPDAVRDTGDEVLSTENLGDKWIIRIKKID
jgi:tRNA 2-thiouridine synthesizing protein A